MLHYPFPVKATQIYNKVSIHLINHHLRTFHKPRCHNFERHGRPQLVALALITLYLEQSESSRHNYTKFSLSVLKQLVRGRKKNEGRENEEFFCIPEWKLLL